MKARHLLLGAALLCLAAVPTLAQGTYAPDEEGWVSLFNGEDLSGWHLRHEGGNNGWSVQDGILTNTAPSTDLISDGALGDIELHVEFRVPQGGNSGVYLQSRYEVQVADSAGAELATHICGGIYGQAAPSENAALPAGEWQSYDIEFHMPAVDRDGQVVRNAWIKVIHNGTQIIETELSGVTGGAVNDEVGKPFGLMLQGDHSSMEYRNIRYRPLGVDWAPDEEFTPLFNGEDLTGWAVKPTGHGSGGLWTVEDGVIVGTQDGPGNGGVLMSDELYGDYELRYEINPDWDIDSGMFLRCADNGDCYQSTVDYRPGGEVGTIYGEGAGGWLQQNPDFGRFYKPNDWNAVRILIAGEKPRIQVWLNGNPLCDFVDTEARLPHEGRIGLQVHGGGDWQGRVTRFRNILIRPLAE